jgi:hypothetical protein
MVRWDLGVSNRDQITIQQKVEGIEMICEASSLQSDLLGFLLHARTDLRENFLAPYYSWLLICISQMLRRDSWEKLHCELPVLSAENLQTQAIALLDAIDIDKSHISLGIALYVPVVYNAGFELRTENERRRVLSYLDSPQAQYFSVSRWFRKELDCAWKKMDQGKDQMTLKALPMHSRAQTDDWGQA